MDMERVGVRELRQHLSVYLRRVARGETLAVTDRGHAVAVLAPLPETAVVETLTAAGRLRPATGSLPTPLPSSKTQMGITDALAEQRADER